MRTVYYGLLPSMGCYGSREMKKSEKSKNTNSYSRLPRFSYCNGRITRIIQDDLVDYCDNSETPDDDPIKMFNDSMLINHEYKTADINGAWISGVCAGGSRNNVELFATNPQFEIKLGAPQEGNKRSEEMVIITLKQIHYDTISSHIGLFIYKNENPGVSLAAENFLCVPALHEVRGFRRTERVSASLRLKYGVYYIIIPAVFHAYHENEFLIHITTAAETAINIRRLVTPVEPEIFYR